MTSSTRVAVSQILRTKDEDAEDGDEPKKKSREDWRKAKELEEARKAGTAPAAVDETGKDINPHIPQYISSAPWYYGSAGPTLKHQRPQEDREAQFTRLDTYYHKGVDTTKLATKFRKGACENCGAMTHKKKDCLERPRKIGAKFTNAGIAPDEFQQPNLNLSYDGKRDRWNGYDPSEHKAIIEEYQKIEEAKRELRAQKLEEDPTATEEDDNEEDEDKYVDEVDMPGTKVDSKQRITVRNLRIREDTAKYLRNLDPNSAYYDPKTRSMRDNPKPNATDSDYAGENFVRFTGDTRAHAVAQAFAWDAQSRGLDVHLLAEPTKLQLLQNQYKQAKDQFKTQVKQSVLEKYGGEEHLNVPPRELLLAQTEVFTQYNRDGTLVHGPEKQLSKSKYEEDVLINNHTSVWGSYWRDGHWGYKCCHSFIKMSYCVGEAGKSVVLNIPEEKLESTLNTQSAEKVQSAKSESSESLSSSSSSSDSEPKTRSKTERTSKKKKNKKKAKKKKKKESKREKKEEDKLKKVCVWPFQATENCTNGEINPTTVDPTTPTGDPTTPTSDPNTPTSDPTTPTSDPNTPTSDPITPTSDPTTPTSDPNTPTSDPITPTSDPTTPTSDPNTPTSDPTTPTSDLTTPTSDPNTPTSDSTTPTSDPNTPTGDPTTPTSDPTTPTSDPNTPTGDPNNSTIDPTTSPSTEEPNDNICTQACNVLPWAHNDCDKYWTCNGDQLVLGICSLGLHFNNATATCDYVCNAACMPAK